ncbi:MAG: hypothetical protein ACUVWR_17795, partial [Anaerolineae bacterium]
MESRKRRSLLMIVSAVAALLLAMKAVLSAFAQGPGRTGPGIMGGMGMMGWPSASSSGCPMGGMGVMAGFAPGNPFANHEPLSLQESIQAVKQYLADLGDLNLELAEVMVFDNHSYARIVEKDTGIGAMELLVDPVTLSVYSDSYLDKRALPERQSGRET